MAEKGLVFDTTLTDIADAIRDKIGSEDTMLPSEMAALIASIKTGGIYASGNKTISGSGTQTFSFTHSLGAVPNLIIIYSYTTYNGVIVSILFPYNTKYHMLVSNGSVTKSSFTPTVTETTASFKATTNLYSGTCYWFAGVL